ncbi:MAG: glycosyltransferase family 39 protein [Candidatus Binatia bacterium]|nr:glycosyltransferase family 39 protein [Candidatus Binatia bacterium]
MPIVDRTVSLADRYPLWSGLVVFCLQIGVRGPGLGQSALWLDESLSLLRTNFSTQHLLRFSATNENPPAYNLMLSAWVELFGLTETGARSLSLLASALAGVFLFLLARRFFSAEVAVLASLLYLDAGMVLNYAQEARSYSLVLLLCVVSFYVYFALLERPSVWRAAILSVVNALAVYTHFTVAIAFLAQLVGLAAVRPPARTAGLYIVSQIAAVGLFSPWIPVLVDRAPVPGVYWLGPPGRAQLLDAIVQLGGGPAAVAAEAGLVVVGAWILMLRGVDHRGLGPRVFALAWWGIASVLLCFVIAQWTPIFLPRYVLFALPGITLLTAVMLEVAVPSRAWRWAAGIALAVSSFMHADLSALPKPDWRVVSAVVQDLRRENDLVFVSPPSGCPTFGFYFDRASFLGPQKLVRGLRAQGVHCVEQVPDLGATRWGRPEAIVLVLKPNSKIDVDATARDRGYRVTSERAIDRVRVVSLARAT